eukprot:sb/3467896/
MVEDHGTLVACQIEKEEVAMDDIPLQDDGLDDIPLQDKQQQQHDNDGLDEEGDLEDEEESEEEGSEGVKTSNSPKIVYDLSSDESSDTQLDRVEERRERKKKKKKLKEKKLQHCCTGCDGGDIADGDIDSLPSPLSSNNALIRCGVIQTLDEVITTLQDSEQEIDNAISSYKEVGCRLAQTEGDGQLSDVDFTAPPLPYSPPRSPSSDGCELSDGVGEKLANRCQIERDERDLDECAGERLTREELGRLSLQQLQSRLQYLRKQLNEPTEIINQSELVI